MELNAFRREQGMQPMSLYQQAKKESFNAIPETCPTIRTKINLLFGVNMVPLDLADDVMRILAEHGTTPLRDAWIAEIEKRMALE